MFATLWMCAHMPDVRSLSLSGPMHRKSGVTDGFIGLFKLLTSPRTCMWTFSILGSSQTHPLHCTTSCSWYSYKVCDYSPLPQGYTRVLTRTCWGLPPKVEKPYNILSELPVWQRERRIHARSTNPLSFIENHIYHHKVLRINYTHIRPLTGTRLAQPHLHMDVMVLSHDDTEDTENPHPTSMPNYHHQLCATSPTMTKTVIGTM